MGFLKEGKYLLGYSARECVDEEENDDFINYLKCIYTLSLWKYDDKNTFGCAPLQKVIFN